MTPRALRLVALALALLAGALVSWPAPTTAHAAKHDKPPPPLTSGPILTRPQTSPKEVAPLPDAVKRAIRATRRGDTIRAAYYRFDLASVTDALIAAHRRGVNVKIVLNRPKPVNRGMARETGRLASVLGISPGGRSFVVSPAASGFGARGNMHAKFLIIDRAGPQHHLSFVGSANLNAGHTQRSYDETQVVVGDRAIHRTLSRYFEAIVAGKHLRKAQRRVSSHGLTLYLYPGAPNVIGRALAHVEAGPGCRMLIATYLWADNRLADARRVARLADRGCEVRMLVNDTPHHLGPKVSATLRRSRVEIRDLRARRHGVDIGLHAKTWIIDRTVYAGSANTSDVTRRRNADILTVRTSRDRAGRASLAAYERWFGAMWRAGRPVATAYGPRQR